MGGLIAKERSLPENLWMDRKVGIKYIHCDFLITRENQLIFSDTETH
jgi:hypothetical protein